MPETISRGGKFSGGTVGRQADVFSEVALIAYHFHWSRAEIMSLSNRERKQWLNKISQMNEQKNLKMRMMMDERRELND